MHRLQRLLFRLYVKFVYAQRRPLHPEDDVWFWAIK
jgi:hypothetical protein